MPLSIQLSLTLPSPIIYLLFVWVLGLYLFTYHVAIIYIFLLY